MRTSQHTSTSRSRPARTGNVLVVEDDSSIRQLVSFVLGRAGYTVTSVEGLHDAESAVERAVEPFVAAVVDLCLPDGRGDQIVQLLRLRSPGTRVVVISAYAQVSLAMQTAAESGDAFLTKPFSNAELLAAVG